MQAAVTSKTTEELDKHAQVLYEWVGNTQPSKVRLIMYWQSQGGLSYVANVHHRMTQAFVACGETKHVGEQQNVAGAGMVTLETFQKCIKERHRIGNDGLSQSSDGLSQEDRDLAGFTGAPRVAAVGGG